MHRLLLSALLALIPALAGGIALAQPGAKPDKYSTHHARARLSTNRDAMHVGEKNWIAVHFDIDPHWHLYWDGVNDSGFAPKITWTAPQGVTIGPMLWPAPKRMISEGDILDHVYENDLTLMAEVSVSPEAAKAQTITIKAAVEWLVCEKVCVPDEAQLSIDIPLRGTKEAPSPTKDAAIFAATRLRIPRPWSPNNPILSVDVRGDVVTIKAQGATSVAFYPMNGCSDLKAPISSAAADGDTLKLTLLPKGKPLVLKGVVEAHAKENDASPILYEVQIPAPAANPPGH
jgi:thiol:disulfide interchange protein DsbD